MGSKLASCLQHLDGGSACCCCTVFGLSMRKGKDREIIRQVWVVGWQQRLSTGAGQSLFTRGGELSMGRVAAQLYIEG